MFANRTEAGRRLAAVLLKRHYAEPVILALPRGGVPVAVAVAGLLEAPLGLVMARKVGLPEQPEVAVGAVAGGPRPELDINDDIARQAGLNRLDIVRLAEPELAEIERRRAFYFENSAQVPVAGRTAIVVDDGVATGATMRAALRALKRQKPKHVVVAVPVAAPDVLPGLSALADEVVCLECPDDFRAVGACYADFTQVSHADVIAALRQSAL